MCMWYSLCLHIGIDCVYCLYYAYKMVDVQYCIVEYTSGAGTGKLSAVYVCGMMGTVVGYCVETLSMWEGEPTAWLLSRH